MYFVGLLYVQITAIVAVVNLLSKLKYLLITQGINKYVDI